MTDNRYCKHMNWNHYKKDTCDKQEDQYYCEVEKKCKHDHKGKSCCRKHEDWKHNYCACEEKSCWKDDRDEGQRRSSPL
ncbi:Spore coat protein OS=Lysinibacillus sphaericus OX=1421 GN=LYSIN_00929 PE=4 SV=1 [Lysinibacillus sphaericus]